MPLFVKTEDNRTQVILGLSEKTPCFKETSNKCFIVQNTSLDSVQRCLDEMSLYQDNLQDFKEENSFISKYPSSLHPFSYFIKLSYDISLWF